MTRPLTQEEIDLFEEFFSFKFEGEELAQHALSIIEAGKMPVVEEWIALSGDIQTSLLDWYNRAEPTIEDYERLLALYRGWGFEAWTCPNCDEEIMVGSPADWWPFQGVRQSEHLGRLCADCGALYNKLKEWAEE